MAVTLAALGLSACGGEGSEGSTSCEPSGTTISVVSDDFAFDADCYAVPADQSITVTLTNHDWEVHNFTVLEPGESRLATPRFSVVASSDRSTTTTWDPMQAGTYEFLCTLHPSMSGPFIVR